MIFRYLHRRYYRRRIRQSFEHYVNPSVLESIIEDAGDPKTEWQALKGLLSARWVCSPKQREAALREVAGMARRCMTLGGGEIDKGEIEKEPSGDAERT
jgi:hypothetical protein